MVPFPLGRWFYYWLFLFVFFLSLQGKIDSSAPNIQTFYLEFKKAFYSLKKTF